MKRFDAIFRPETARVACGAVGVASGGTYHIVNTFYKVLPLCDRQQIEV
jgi:hypothetical protein